MFYSTRNVGAQRQRRTVSDGRHPQRSGGSGDPGQTQNRRRKGSRKPEWDSTVSNLERFRLTPAEVEARRHERLFSENHEAVRAEERARLEEEEMQREAATRESADIDVDEGREQQPGATSSHMSQVEKSARIRQALAILEEQLLDTEGMATGQTPVVAVPPQQSRHVAANKAPPRATLTEESESFVDESPTDTTTGTLATAQQEVLALLRAQTTVIERLQSRIEDLEGEQDQQSEDILALRAEFDTRFADIEHQHLLERIDLQSQLQESFQVDAPQAHARAHASQAPAPVPQQMMGAAAAAADLGDASSLLLPSDAIAGERDFEEVDGASSTSPPHLAAEGAPLPRTFNRTTWETLVTDDQQQNL
jgi:hypothetical protein